MFRTALYPTLKLLCTLRRKRTEDQLMIWSKRLKKLYNSSLQQHTVHLAKFFKQLTTWLSFKNRTRNKTLRWEIQLLSLLQHCSTGCPNKQANWLIQQQPWLYWDFKNVFCQFWKLKNDEQINWKCFRFQFIKKKLNCLNFWYVLHSFGLNEDLPHFRKPY